MQIFFAHKKREHTGLTALPAVLLLTTLVMLASLTPTIPAYAQTGTLIDDPAQLTEGEVIRIEEGEVRQLAFSPDEATLAIATSAGLWIYGPSPTSNGQLIDETAVQLLWWAPDGNLLAALTDDGALQIWQLIEPQSSITLTSTAAIASVAWSPDSSQLATGSAAGVIELWTVGDPQPFETLEGHTGQVNLLYWFKDGTQLVSGAADGSVRVWQFEGVAPLAPTPIPTPPPPLTATVQTDVLNIRSGPATSFEKLGNVKRNESVTVVGQSGECAWYQVRTASGLAGWVNGNPQFITLNGACADLTTAPVAASAPLTPTLAATTQLTPTPTPPPPAAAPAAPTPTPTAAAVLPTATPAPAEDPFPPNKGCFLFQNQLGPELTVTITAKEGNFTETFKVVENQETPYCLDPGRYTYTIDAPPPWADINGELDVKAGDRFMFPIRAQ